MRRTDSREKISQDEIISNTKNVLRGLETLKNEHDGLLVKLSDKQRNGESDPTKRRETAEKMEAIEKSLEKIELGLGEAQVFLSILSLVKVKVSVDGVFRAQSNIYDGVFYENT